MLVPLMFGSLALHPAACVQRNPLDSARAAASLYGPPLLQPATRMRQRVPLAPTMASPSELIELGVRADTFLPQFAWLLIVAFPRAKVTESIMGPIGPILALSLIHLAIVLLAATAPGGTEPILIFADVFDPAQSQLDGMVRLFQVRVAGGPRVLFHVHMRVAARACAQACRACAALRAQRRMCTYNSTRGPPAMRTWKRPVSARRAQ